jgi:FkbM family methyltransferase
MFIINIIPKRIIKKIIQNKLENEYILFTDFNISFSQQGEDIIIQNYFENKFNGFFIDIGAYHPIKYSNTFALYLKGWKGINIEPNPDNIQLFQNIRRRDINLNIGVSDKNEILTYNKFNNAAVNTFNNEHALTWSKKENFFIEKTMQIEVKPLHEIISKYKPKDTLIDLMSIDCEGMDFLVLKSNNWEKYRPKMLLVEFPIYDISNYYNDEIHKFLIANDYILHAICGITAIFIDLRNDIK